MLHHFSLQSLLSKTSFEVNSCVAVSGDLADRRAARKGGVEGENEKSEENRNFWLKPGRDREGTPQAGGNNINANKHVGFAFSKRPRRPKAAENVTV